jgi:hypothetical protein
VTGWRLAPNERRAEVPSASADATPYTALVWPVSGGPRGWPVSADQTVLGRSGNRIDKHSLRLDTGGTQCGELGREVLAGGADPGVAENCLHQHTVS